MTAGHPHLAKLSKDLELQRIWPAKMARRAIRHLAGFGTLQDKDLEKCWYNTFVAR
jgi:hypothetical protein